MIKELTIKNFRSIREATLELGRITVLNGANNSGKSSVLYALQVLKNVVTNPNRTTDELFNLFFLSLGGFEEIIFHTKEGSIEIEISSDAGNIFGILKSRYKWKQGLLFGARLDIQGIEPFKFNGYLRVSFPYNLNKMETITINGFNGKEIVWNGIAVKTNIDEFKNVSPFDYHSLKEQIELPVVDLSNSEIIPTQRGFTKPIFNQVPMTGTIYTEEEVATHLAIDKKLQSKVAHYFEKITGKRFSVSMGPGGGFFYLQVREPDTPFTTELVNQGMGTNQILFMLAKILYDKNRLICIDEPEIHLHPTLIEQFVKVLVEIAHQEDKQFIFSTHSEHWLMSLLAEVNDGNLKAEDLKVYYLTKEGQETKVENQEVHPNGQIEGGLKNFLEAQLRLSNRFFDAQTA